MPSTNCLCQVATRTANSHRTKVLRSPLSTYPIAKPLLGQIRYYSRLNCSAPAGEFAEALKKDGCVVVQNMFSKSEIARLNADVNEPMAKIPAGKSANVNDGPLPDGADGYVFGENTKRLSGLLNTSSVWREEMLDNNVLHGVSEEALKELGGYWLSDAQMIEIGPGTKAQPLHADGAGWWPFWSGGEKWKPEFALNFLIAVTDTTKANGATGVVRGSHEINYSELPDDGTFNVWSYPDEKVEQIELSAGDCLILSSRIVHRGETNATADEYRRILSCTVLSSTLTPEEANPLTIDKELARFLPERVKKFIGFRGLKTSLGPDVWQNHQGDLSTKVGF